MHYYIIKAARILGLDLVAVPVDDRQRLRDDLSDAVLVLIAGTDAADLELTGRPVTGVVNWRHREQIPLRVRSRMHDAWIGLADITGDSWFRSVSANPLADPQHVIDAVPHALNYAAAPRGHGVP